MEDAGKVIAYPHTMELALELPSVETAELVLSVLEVDKEISTNCTRKCSLVPSALDDKTSVIKAFFEAKELRNLRVSVGSFLDMFILSCETVVKFKNL
eukprot:m.198503 g.198503  ORF g.198503 m.198503 type:complete len:98 (+) comp18751_c0_seq2:248-541(+)